MADTSELLPSRALLLRLCDGLLNQNSQAIMRAAVVEVARALKSRLQAEAPEDAEVAEIAKRHEDEGKNPWLDLGSRTAHADRATLLAKLQSRTSQAEAQAPTTAAQAMSKPIADIRTNTEREAQDRTNTAAAETAIGRMVLVRDLTAILEDFERVTPQAESTSENRAAFIADRLTVGSGNARRFSG